MAVGTGQGRKRRSQSTKFPSKLHDMMEYVEANGLESVISWALNGRGIIVHDTTNIMNILPLFFDQTKYRSFRRQLNLWHFERVTDGPHEGAFLHPYFVRGDRSLCLQMSRDIYSASKLKTETKTKEKGGNANPTSSASTLAQTSKALPSQPFIHTNAARQQQVGGENIGFNRIATTQDHAQQPGIQQSIHGLYNGRKQEAAPVQGSIDPSSLAALSTAPPSMLQRQDLLCGSNNAITSDDQRQTLQNVHNPAESLYLSMRRANLFQLENISSPSNFPTNQDTNTQQRDGYTSKHAAVSVHEAYGSSSVGWEAGRVQPSSSFPIGNSLLPINEIIGGQGQFLRQPSQWTPLSNSTAQQQQHHEPRKAEDPSLFLGGSDAIKPPGRPKRAISGASCSSSSSSFGEAIEAGNLFCL